MKAILSALCLSLIAHTVSAANSVPKAPVDGQPIRASRDSARWCEETIHLLWKNRERVIARCLTAHGSLLLSAFRLNQQAANGFATEVV